MVALNDQTMLISGGYDNVGRSLAELLLPETDVRVVLARPNIEKAMAAADESPLAALLRTLTVMLPWVFG